MAPSALRVLYTGPRVKATKPPRVYWVYTTFWSCKDSAEVERYKQQFRDARVAVAAQGGVTRTHDQQFAMEALTFTDLCVRCVSQTVVIYQSEQIHMK